MRIWIRKNCLQIYEFAICGLGYQGNLWIYLICDLRTGTPKKFADLRLRNVPKNLRICDPRKTKKYLRAHLCKSNNYQKKILIRCVNVK
jgi:hypothetical protein